MKFILRKQCDAKAAKLCDMRAAAKQACELMAIDEYDINCIALAIDEACSNIIRYAYKDDDKGPIVLEVYQDEDNAFFYLQDFAEAVDHSCIEPHEVDLMKPGGLGVHLIHKVMDSARFVQPRNGCGNMLELRKNLNKDRQHDV